MKIARNCKKTLTVLLAVILIAVQITGLNIFTNASNEWSDDLLTNQADLHLTDTNKRLLDITLDEDTTYQLEFDMKVNALSTTKLAVILRESEDGNTGVYSDYWFSSNQIRNGADIQGNGWPMAANDTIVNGAITFAENTTYAVKYIIEPEKVYMYINNSLVKVSLGISGGLATSDFTTVSKVADAKIGFLAQSSAPDVDISNIVVKKDKNATGGGGNTEPQWSENILINQADIALTDLNKNLLDVTLDRDTRYQFEFNIKVNKIATTNLAVILRESADAVNGVYSDFWFSMNQIRTGADINGLGFDVNANDTLVTSETFAEGTTYAVKYIIEPEKVYMYINGSLIKVTLGSSGGFSTADYTKVSRIVDGKIGFIAQSTEPDIDITDIVLKKDLSGPILPDINMVKVQQAIDLINGIGTVTTDSKSAIMAAREAYDALNDDEKSAVTNYSTLTDAENEYRVLTTTYDMRLYGLDATYAMGYNHWGSSVKVTNTIGGGMHFEWKNCGTNMRQGINRSIQLDGLHATFTGLDLVGANKAIAFYFADMDSQESYTQFYYDVANNYLPLALILDTTAGKLSIAYSDETSVSSMDAKYDVLATSDALKIANLKEKEWDMNFSKNPDGSYKVTVAGVEGTITKAMIERCNKLTQTEDVYITVTPWGSGISGTLDILSLHDGTVACANTLSSTEMEQVFAVIEKIKNIGTVTKDSLPDIESAEALYNALNDTQKKCVTNFNSLSAARYRYDSLTNSKEILCNKYYYITAEDFMGMNHWPSNLTVESISGGGANIKWVASGTNYRQGISRQISLDGLHMAFSGLEAEDSNKKLALFVAGLYDTAADWTSMYSEFVAGKSTILALVFDFDAGTLTAHVENNPDVIVLRDSRLTYEFLKGTQWEFNIKQDKNGDYTVSVGDISGTLPASLVEKAERITNPENVYITLSPWGAAYDIAINIDSIHGGDVVCAEDLTQNQLNTLQKVIFAINDIYNEKWQIVPEAESKFAKAIELYENLPMEMRALVANLKDLDTAETVMEVVLEIEDIGEVTLDSGDIIQSVRDMYKALLPSQRYIVGNYATLNKAILEFYLLEKAYALYGVEEDFYIDDYINNEIVIENDTDNSLGTENDNESNKKPSRKSHKYTEEGINIGILIAIIIASIIAVAVFITAIVVAIILVCKKRRSIKKGV